LTLVLCWLTWQVRREADPTRKELLIRAYARLCAKLAAVGLPRLAHEGAEDYAIRVAQRRPDLGPAVTAFCRHYSTLRYAAAAPARITIAQFHAAVRAFRPRSKPVK
jgi:protein-glutamine gamma-glutamyltransferase